MNVCVRVFIYLLKEFFISHWFLQKLQVRASTVLLRGAEVGCGPAFPLASGTEQINRQARLSCQWCASCGFYLHNEYKDGLWLPGNSEDQLWEWGLGRNTEKHQKRGWLVWRELELVLLHSQFNSQYLWPVKKQNNMVNPAAFGDSFCNYMHSKINNKEKT